MAPTPVAPLIQATDGLIYGTTSAGGAYGFGTVFSLDSADTLTTVHHFAGADGANPNAGVLQGLDGRLYGTTTNGGAFGYGTVFVMNVTGGLDDAASLRVERWRQSGQRADPGERRRLLRRGADGRTDGRRRDLPRASRHVTA